MDKIVQAKPAIPRLKLADWLGGALCGSPAFVWQRYSFSLQLHSPNTLPEVLAGRAVPAEVVEARTAAPFLPARVVEGVTAREAAEVMFRAHWQRTFRTRMTSTVRLLLISLATSRPRIRTTRTATIS